MYKDIDDTLQHFGVKGMKWGVKNDNTDSQDNSMSGGGGGGSEDEDLKKKLEDLLNKMGLKFNSLDDAIKAKGLGFLKSLFGESKPTSKIIDTNKADKVGDLKRVNVSLSNKHKTKDALTKKLESQGYVEIMDKKPKDYHWKFTSIAPGSKADRNLESELAKRGFKEIKGKKPKDYTWKVR